MSLGLRSVVTGALLLAGGCEIPPSLSAAPAAPEATPHPVGPAAMARESSPHDEAHFLVRRGGDLFRANVRFVEMLDESVIAIRRGPGESDETWTVIDVPTTGGSPPPTLPFSAAAWEPVALEIAEAVRDQDGICEEGERMQLIPASGGGPRTMFRHNRQAWIVFAACPEPWKG